VTPEKESRSSRGQAFLGATPHAEFLYDCVSKSVEEDLPHETDFLQRYGALRREVDSFLDMSERMIDLLIHFLHQNDGRISRRVPEKEFSVLTEQEVSQIETFYRKTFRN